MNIRDVHDRIEAAFETWGYVTARRRWAIAWLGLALTAALASGIPHMRFDNSTESFLRPNDPARAHYDRFRELFGQDEFLVISIEAPDLFELGFLARLRDFHRAIESQVPYVLEVTSLLNARNTRGEADRLVVEDLLERWPESQADLAALRERVLETPLYRNNLIDARGRIAAIAIEPNLYSHRAAPSTEEVLAGFDDAAPGASGAPLLSEEEQAAQIAALQDLVAQWDAPEFRLRLTGGGVASRHATAMLLRDATVMMSASVGVVGLFLFALFRRLSAVVLPLLVVLAALLSTFGIQVRLDIPASVSGNIVPALLLTVGICGAVHLLAIFYRRLAAGDSTERALAGALGHSGLAIAMASLTTAAGLLSFSSAELAQVADLGVVAPIGVLLCFVYVVTVLPALLAIFPLRPRAPRGDALQRRLSSGLARLGGAAAERPGRVLLGAGAIALLGVAGAAQLHFSQYLLGWFPVDDPVRQDAEFMNRALRGASTLEFVLDTGRQGGLRDPAVLRRIEAALARAEAFEDGDIFVGRSFSILDVVKESHKALHENRHAYYAIPDSPELLAQELLLFEQSGSDDLEELTDTRFQLARVSLRVPFADGMLFPAFIRQLEEIFAEELGDGIAIQATGLGSLFARTFSVVNITMARSYALALLVITPLMILLIGNLRQGLVSMVPNLLPILLTLGLMGALDIPLDNSSLLIGCVIIGLAVDDTIHFMHKFQRYFAKSGDAREAVRETLATTGSALLFTSLVLVSGFLVMTLAYMRNAAQFGLLAAFATVVAFLADVILAPALLVLISRPPPAAAGPTGSPGR